MLAKDEERTQYIKIDLLDNEMNHLIFNVPLVIKLRSDALSSVFFIMELCQQKKFTPPLCLEAPNR